MSFDALQERLSALQETTAQLRGLIDRLAHLKFQPGSVPLSAAADDDETNVAAELSTEINQILREEEEDLELLAEEIADRRAGRPGSETEHAKARLRDAAARLEADLRACRVAFRKAQLEARRSLEAAHRAERELLLASYSQVASQASSAVQSGRNSPTTAAAAGAGGSSSEAKHTQLFPAGYRPHRKGKKKADEGEDGLVAASSSVTAALRRTHALMSSELSRSEFARQTLDESTAALESLQHRYAGLDDLLQSSRDLVGTLLTSNKSDTWYLETALWMLLATLGWLVFRRWVYGPAWWLVWLPLRTFWGVGKGAVGMVGGGGGSRGVEVVVRDQDQGAGKVTGLDEQGHVPVPTILTGNEKVEEDKVGTDPDSLLEQVGRMVDEVEMQLGGELKEGEDEGLESGAAELEEAAGEDINETETDVRSEHRTNPMKRVWEEDKEAAEADDLPNPMKRMWEEDKEAAEADDLPNPMKRMWEEDREAANHEAERPRDEL